MEILDTIVALATPRQISALAIVRMSGPSSLYVLSRMIKKNIDEIKPNYTFFSNVYEDKNKKETIIDQAVITFFKGPRSYTGEDTVEFSIHGSPLVADKLINACIKNGARSARKGEYSLKAYLNSKMSLLQLEGVNDFIKNTSENARKLAMNALNGETTQMFQSLKNDLLDVVAETENILEDDLTNHDDYLIQLKQLSDKKIIPILNTSKLDLEKAKNGKKIYNGINVVIVGKPNVGKSTLLNSLIGKDKAIVTSIPGTTRDVIEGEIEIDGTLFKFKDTAGLHSTNDVIEKLGIDKTIQELKNANIILLVDDKDLTNISADLQDLIKTKQIIKVGSKKDLGNALGADIETSGLTNDIEQLKKALLDRVGITDINNETVLLSERDMGFLENFIHYIELALQSLLENGYADAFSDMLLRAINEINEILGENKGQTQEDIYSTIFSKFCMGK